MKSIGETVRRLRRQEGMTQYQLAQRLGISASAVGMYEQGRRALSSDMLLKICELFGVSADVLLGVPEQAQEARDIIEEMSNQIRYSDKIMLNGMPMSRDDRERLLSAIELATQLTLDRRS